MRSILNYYVYLSGITYLFSLNVDIVLDCSPTKKKTQQNRLHAPVWKNSTPTKIGYSNIQQCIEAHQN